MAMPRLRTVSLAPALHSLRAEGRLATNALVIAGRFNRSGIMAEAVRLARTGFRTLGSWQRRMSAGLTEAWKRARAALTAPALVVPAYQARPTAPRGSAFVPRVRTFVRGSRAHSHGW